LRRLISGFWLCCLGILLAACTAAEAKTYQLHLLSHLPNYTALNAATDINSSGVVIGYNASPSGSGPCVIWDAQGVHYARATAYAWLRPQINASGQMVSEGLFWPNGAFGLVTDLPSVYGSYSNQLRGINDLGEIAGQSVVNAQYDKHACLWDATGAHDLGALPGTTGGYANALNNQRLVVGSSTIQNAENRAFSWQNGHMTELPTAAGYDGSNAYSVNNSGFIVGASHRYEGTGGNKQEYEVGCVWKDGVLTQLEYAGFSTRGRMT
jgi:probable HAF family extracellular repeat protein